MLVPSAFGRIVVPQLFRLVVCVFFWMKTLRVGKVTSPILLPPSLVIVMLEFVPVCP